LSTKAIKFIEKINGELQFMGDKSVSHRALIFTAMAEGASKIFNLSLSDDVRSTMNCLSALGAGFKVEKEKTTTRVITVKGVGYKGFTAPETILNAGNSGTTARLLAGLLAVQDFESEITGDESLQRRPMDRISIPLNSLGSKIKLNENKYLPIKIKPGKITPQEITLSVASAQVKSALILAGLHTEDGALEIIDPYETRNHTEEMLGILRVPVGLSPAKKMVVSKKNYPKAGVYTVPGDISSAMFFIVLALIAGEKLTVKNLLLSSERIAALEILKRMEGNIEIIREETGNCGRLGDIVVHKSDLINTEILPEEIPLIIDEIPALSIAGLFAEGGFLIRNAKELRLKETDRISAIVKNLKACGVDVEEYEDGFLIYGKELKEKGKFESFGDHRIAMAFSVLAALLNEGGLINDYECVSVSNPDFYKQLDSITVRGRS